MAVPGLNRNGMLVSVPSSRLASVQPATGPQGVPGPQGIPGVSHTGWCAYVHTGASQALVANVKTSLLNNAGSRIETQKPDDVSDLYNGAVILGRNGDAIIAGIEFTFTPSSGLASWLSVSIDIGGSVGELYAQEYSVLYGSGVGHRIAYTAAAYTLDTWQTNGGSVKVLSDGPGVVTGVRYVIHRIHKAGT